MHCKPGAGTKAAIKNGHRWMLDNGMFTGAFDVDVWLSLLDELLPWAPNCIGVVVPDVVGDWQATVDQYAHYRPMIPWPYAVAFVTQDGLPSNRIPVCDVLFVGGSNHHKLVEAPSIVRSADQWVHIGRVNSVRRIRRFWWADSCDGTGLAIEPSPNYQRLFLRACDEASSMRRQGQFL